MKTCEINYEEGTASWKLIDSCPFLGIGYPVCFYVPHRYIYKEKYPLPLIGFFSLTMSQTCTFPF